mmetsp:Transcript_42453/g.85553  ORF Transcript_42453/g.85553 Transcript_42453/m.85553 type:complete len:345 (-) Transcript_42453:41-1075(-)
MPVALDCQKQNQWSKRFQKLHLDNVIGAGRPHDWVERWAVQDAALVRAADDAHVALLTPAGAPRILHLPILLAAVTAVADGENGMVKAGAAARALDDARGVEFEHLHVGLDVDCYWLLVQSSHEALLGALDGRIIDQGTRRKARSTAGAPRGSLARCKEDVPASVGVLVLSAEGVGLHVVEAVLLQAATAPEIPIPELGAVDKLLLAERDQLAGCDLPSALECASGAEGPAASALPLILHRCHRTLGHPVDFRRKVLALVAMDADGGNLLTLVQTTVHGAKLRVRQVGEHVHAQCEARVLLIHGLDHLLIPGENLLTRFVVRAVIFAELLDEVLEILVERGLRA